MEEYAAIDCEGGEVKYLNLRSPERGFGHLIEGKAQKPKTAEEIQYSTLGKGIDLSFV